MRLVLVSPVRKQPSQPSPEPSQTKNHKNQASSSPIKLYKKTYQNLKAENGRQESPYPHHNPHTTLQRHQKHRLTSHKPHVKKRIHQTRGVSTHRRRSTHRQRTKNTPSTTFPAPRNYTFFFRALQNTHRLCPFTSVRTSTTNLKRPSHQSPAHAAAGLVPIPPASLHGSRPLMW